MRYLIIGLGIYGSNLARDLTDMGHEVIGVDSSQASVDAIKDYISTVYIMDVTEEANLALLPLNNVDLVIVTIGENFGASVKVVAMLKTFKVKHIYARAIDKLHQSILEGFALDRIITPEQRAARDLTFELALGYDVRSLAVDDNNNYVLRFKAPKKLVGLKYSDIDLSKNYHIELIAVSRAVERKNIMGISHAEMQKIDLSQNPDLLIAETDELTCLASRSDCDKFFKIIND